MNIASNSLLNQKIENSKFKDDILKSSNKKNTSITLVADPVG